MPKLFEPEELFLSNGIPVILQHYDVPVAATYWWIRTGSADEKRGEEGFAHFLEHMLFKDAAAKETGRASTGQMARAIESLGGDINAYTSFDQTVYHVTCAAHHWEKVIDVFGAMAKPQRFLKSDFVREREVILEELRKNEDAPGRQLFQNLFSQTFKKHPYGRPVIGYVKTLKAANVAKLEAFYKRNYASEKMGVILVGPIEDKTGARKKAVLKLLEKRFGSGTIPKRASPDLPRVQDAPLANAALPPVRVVPFDVKTPTVSISFRVPDLFDEDTPGLELMAGVLGMGELSRLYQQLFYKTSTVTDVSGGLYTPRDPGMLYFQCEVSSMDKIRPAYEQMLRELARIKKEGPTADELKRVVTNAESEKLYSTQSADGMAGRVGFLKFVLGDMNYDHKYVEKIRSIDEASIRATAENYLVTQRMSLILMVPKEHENFDVAGLGELAREILGTSAQPKIPAKKVIRSAEGRTEFFELAGGTKVAFTERPQSHVFSIHAAALGGLRLESGKDWGASNLMAQTWTKGAGGMSAREISAVVEGSAAGLEGFSGRNSIGLQATALARDWGKISELFSKILVAPAFPKEEIEHSRRVIEDSIRGVEDHSSQLCSKLFLETLFEHHPYGKMTHGSLESVAALQGERLGELHRQWIRPERLVISVSGPIKRAALDAWLGELSRKLSSSMSALSASPIDAEPALKAPRWVEKTLGREQAHILVGGLGTVITAEDRHALRLLQNVLGGQSGRLFIELREKKSLAYTVAPVSFEGMERGYAGTYIACAPGKKDEALAGIRVVLEKLAKQGPTPAEVKRAKEFFLGRRAMEMQGDTAIAAHHGLESLYGIPYLDDAAMLKKIQAISSKDMKRVCAKYLVEPFMVTAVVG